MFPKLDPYGPPVGRRILGGWPNFGGKAPFGRWVRGKSRVFFYMNLRDSPICRAS